MSDQFDQVVAERVMGWDFKEDPEARSMVPPYSSALLSAMLVVEALNERKVNGWGLRVTMTQDWHGQWLVSVYRMDKWIADSGWHGTLAYALCTAAVAAVMRDA
jgi:hypothetical protein